jgi:hypothetical protein
VSILVRAVFQCTDEIIHFGNEGVKTFRLQQVYDPTVGDDPQFSDAVPVGPTEILLDSPSEVFALGERYHCAFTVVTPPPPEGEIPPEEGDLTPPLEG